MRTYGTVVLDRKAGVWKIKAEPHVVLRLKRVFGKLDRAGHGTHRISDTAENALDLQWFLQRYPMSVTPAEYLERRVREQRDRIEEMEAILSGTRPARTFDLALPARQYQRVAAELAMTTGGLLLADDVGTGKTVSAICMLQDPRTRPAVVVTLTHLPRQWASELQRFAPGLRWYVAKTTRPSELTKRQREPVQPDVIILNYHKLSGWAEALAAAGVNAVVFDECQELRHARNGQRKSAKYNAAKHLASRVTFRLGMSATPIFNYGGEIWNVLECLRPGALGNHGEFAREWCGSGYGDKIPIRDPKAFGTYLRDHGLMLRRTRAELGRELPQLTTIPHYVDADTRELDRIGDRAAELARLILDQHESVRGEKWKASEEISYLVRQATGIAKAPYVADFVRLLVESGERVLLYGWHHAVYALWRQRLEDLGAVTFTGEDSVRQKETAKQAFIAGDARIMMMSLRAGQGIDGLQKACRTVVFGELDWSPAVHEQAIGRIYRDGQSDAVAAYYLIADSGSDPVIADVLGLKRAQLEGIRDPNRELVERLQGDADNVRRLAEALLAQRGIRPSAPGSLEREPARMTAASA